MNGSRSSASAAVGLSAVQVAAALGARVVAVGRSPEKLAKARAEGAEIAIQAGPDVAAAIVDTLRTAAPPVTIDALGSSDTTLPALRPRPSADDTCRLG